MKTLPKSMDDDTFLDVIVLRGLPGAGKSTVALGLLDAIGERKRSGIVVSADDFFTDENGVYSFKPHKLREAHARCLGSYIDSMYDGFDAVIVDNTNTQMWEMRLYLRIAHLARRRIHVIEVGRRDDDHVKMYHARCVHGVPLDKLFQMRDRWEQCTFPGAIVTTLDDGSEG